MLALGERGITSVIAFRDTELFGRFGLPERLVGDLTMTDLPESPSRSADMCAPCPVR